MEKENKPIVSLSGDHPFGWAVNVNWHVSGSEIKFNATVQVGSWVALSADFDEAEQAKQEGCAMMAAMTEELQESVHA